MRESPRDSAADRKAELEWGWKTPLLLRLSAGADGIPEPVARFLATPFADLARDDADRILEARVAELRTYRIGVRFERVQEALFRAHPATESLRTSLVVPGRTEIDLLHRLRGLPDVAIHWEIAVKYYLGLDAEGSDGPDRWVGPSLKDTLGVKMRTIFGRQLPILADADVRARHAEEFGLFPDDRILRYPKVHGALYRPFRALAAPERVPPEIAPGSARGAWCAIDELPEFLAEAATSFGPDARVRWLRDRYDWLRETRLVERPDDEAEFKDWLKSSPGTALRSRVAGGGDPVHLAVLGDRRELRFFVVPTEWRARAERFVAALETRTSGGRIKT